MDAVGQPPSVGLLDVANYAQCVAVHVGPNPSPNMCNSVMSVTIASAFLKPTRSQIFATADAYRFHNGSENSVFILLACDRLPRRGIREKLGCEIVLCFL